MVVDDRFFLSEWAEIVKKPVSYVQEFLDIGVNVIAIDMKTKVNILFYFQPNN